MSYPLYIIGPSDKVMQVARECGAFKYIHMISGRTDSWTTVGCLLNPFVDGNTANHYSALEAVEYMRRDSCGEHITADRILSIGVAEWFRQVSTYSERRRG